MTYSIRDFLEIRTAAVGAFSPDGSKVLVASNLPGVTQLYSVPRTGGHLQPVTSFDEPVVGRYLPTSDEVLFLRDEGGNERHQIYRIRDDGSDLRTVVHDPEFIHRVGGVSRDGRLVSITCNRRNGVDFDVYVRDLDTGDERCVFQIGGWCEAAGSSPDGRFVAVSHLTERSFDNDVYLVDLHTDDVLHIAAHDQEAVVGTPEWLPDGSAFFFTTDIDRDYVAIASYDMRSGGWERMIERNWDLRCAIDQTGSHLLVAANEDGYTTLAVHDPISLELRGEIELPGRGIAGTAFSRDGRYLGVGFQSSVEPGDVWIYDLADGTSSRLTTSPNPVDRGVFVEPELHRFASFDDESIPVFLYRARDASGDLPVVVLIHGGPEAQYVPIFNPIVQYLAWRGFAVVAPNVRGSTGYGKRYHRLDDIRSRLDSVRDLASLHGWLRSTPGLDADRAALMGGSYGGYMVLAGLAFQPELWAAGVDIVGISSFVTFLSNTAPWRRKFREREYGSLERDRDFLVEASPLTHIDRINAPLLIIHGTNDPRVPLSEAEQIYAAVRGKGLAAELLVYPDEGHGLAKLHNRLDAYPKAVDFLDRVLVRAAV